MSDKNKQKRVFKSMQLLGPECLNEWIRLRLPTNEGIWFMPTDLSQLNQQRATGMIANGLPYFIRSSCPGCTNRWVRLYLLTEKFIRFYPIRWSENSAFGRINTNDYASAVCQPFPAVPKTLTGTWETNYGTMYLKDVGDEYYYYQLYGLYQYNSSIGGSITGVIPYATPWGYDLYGQWREGSRIGRFKWTIAADERSFTGTWGNGDNFDGGGTWMGTKVSSETPEIPIVFDPNR